MPELPEVETIRNNLRQGTPDQPALLGRRILDAWLSWERTLAEPAPQVFHERIAGQSIREIGRRGKFIRFYLTHDELLVHLRMSGDLVIRPAAQPPEQHDRLILELEGGLALAFNDTRKFGRVWLTNQPENVLGKLGPEPLDAGFLPEDLYASLQAHRRQLKPLLLDQTFLAGLGNIYTDEALHLARLHPLTPSNRLSLEDSRRLWSSIRQVLQEGVRLNGTSIDWVYRGGGFQQRLRVYDRAGEPCVECGRPIVRIVVGQRGTHICPQCQPPPEN